MQTRNMVFLLMVVLSCRTSHQLYDAPSASPDGTFARDLPLTPSGDTVDDYAFFSRLGSVFGLSRIEDGTALPEIRIWYNYARRDSAQLVRISKSAEGWTADLYTMLITFGATRDSIISISKTHRSAIPLSGWRKFIDQLEEMGIQSLPDWRQIKGYDKDAATDANSVYVQVADSRRYRLYCYTDPSFHPSAEAKKMEAILQLVQRELSFTMLGTI